MDKKMVKTQKISKDRQDIELLKTSMVGNLFDDNDGMMGIASEFVNQTRAAQLLGISIPTLRKYVKNGFVTRFSHGRRRYYRLEEIKRAKENIFS